eukprot:1514617-Amphidinium_carterae.1
MARRTLGFWWFGSISFVLVGEKLSRRLFSRCLLKAFSLDFVRKHTQSKQKSAPSKCETPKPPKSRPKTPPKAQTERVESSFGATYAPKKRILRRLFSRRFLRTSFRSGLGGSCSSGFRNLKK